MAQAPDAGCGATWSQRLDVAGKDDAAIDVIPLGSGESLVVGVAENTSNAGRAWAAKLNGNGTIAWENVYHVGTSSRFESVIELSGGDFVAIGSAVRGGDREMYAVSFDGNGNLNWAKTYEGEDDDAGRDLIEVGNDVWLVGWTESFDSDTVVDRDIWLVIASSSSGSVGAEYRIGTSSPTASTGYMEQANTILLDPNPSPDQVVIAGWLDSNGNGPPGDLLALRIDNTLLQTSFTIAYGGSGFDSAHESVLSGSDVILVGEEASETNSSNIWLISIDSNGDVNWEQSYYDPNNDVDEVGWDVWELDSGRLLVGGWSAPNSGVNRDSYDMILFDADETDGDLSGGWIKYYDAYPGDDYFDKGCGVAEASDGDLFFVGESDEPSTSTYLDAWTLKLDSGGDVSAMGTAGVCNFDDPSIDPNASMADKDDTIALSFTSTSATESSHSPGTSTSLSRDVRCP